MPNPVPWISVTLDDLDAYLVEEQRDALSNVALGDGQADPFTVHSPDVITRIRAEVQKPLANRISATPGTIPPSLKWVACYLILSAMQTRISIALPLTEDQRKQVSRADDYLKRVNAGEVSIEEPTDPLPGGNVSRPAGISQVSGGARLATRDRLRGF